PLWLHSLHPRPSVYRLLFVEPSWLDAPDRYLPIVMRAFHLASLPLLMPMLATSLVDVRARSLLPCAPAPSLKTASLFSPYAVAIQRHTHCELPNSRALHFLKQYEAHRQWN